MIQNISAAVFDFDGTLVDSERIKRQTFFDITADIPNAEVFLGELLSRSPPLDRHQISRYLAELTQPAASAAETANAIVDEYSQICRERISKAPDIPGAKEIISALNELSIPIFISSATPLQELEKLVAVRSWAFAIQQVFGSPEKKIEHLETIHTYVRGRRKDILFVGDSSSDYDAAAHFGCAFAALGVARSLRPCASFQGEDLIAIQSQLFR